MSTLPACAEIQDRRRNRRNMVKASKGSSSLLTLIPKYAIQETRNQRPVIPADLEKIKFAMRGFIGKSSKIIMLSVIDIWGR